MEKNTLLLIFLFIFVFSYIIFWVYIFFFKYPKEIKERSHFILKEFDDNKEILINDLFTEKKIIISKKDNWRYEENKFIKNDIYLLLEELINPSYYNIENIKKERLK